MKTFAAFRTPASLRVPYAKLLCAVICASLLPVAAHAAAVNLTVDPATNNAAAVAELAGAIRAAATNHHATVINLFHKSVYTLTQPDNWEYGPNGLPQIRSDLTIHGHGATILRPTNAAPFRFFYVSGGLSHNNVTKAGLPAGSLTLKNLTLKGGLARGGDASGEAGGGAGMGGAIFNQGALNLNGVTLTENNAQGGSGGMGPGSGGGGIGGSATGSNGGGFGGSFLGNGGNGGAGGMGGGGGGGGFQPGDNGPAAGTNSPGAGGGLGMLGNLGLGDGGGGGAVEFGIVSNNAGGGGFGFGGLGIGGFGEACGGGGGIGGGGGHGGFSGADGDGGFGGGGGGGGESGGRGGFGGGGGSGDSPARAGFAGANGTPEDGGGGGGGGLGGAIFNHRGSLSLTNCTLTANAARGGGGFDESGFFQFGYTTGAGGAGYGGGIFNLNGAVTMNSCTVASNLTVPGLTFYFDFSNGDPVLTNAPTGLADAGAFYNVAYGNHIEDGGASLAEAAFQNSILADSVGSVHDVVNRVVNGSQTNTALIVFCNQNLVMSWTNTTTSASSNAPTVTADPKLGPLADNGGLTPTMALLPGSPAIDQGSAGGLSDDQRGHVRPFVLCSAGPLPGDGSDIGAYEFDLPILHIAGGPGGVVLSWSTAFPGCSLQATATPHLPGTWASISCHPATVGCDFVVTNASAGGLLFYRLTVP